MYVASGTALADACVFLGLRNRVRVPSQPPLLYVVCAESPAVRSVSGACQLYRGWSSM